MKYFNLFHESKQPLRVSMRGGWGGLDTLGLGVIINH